MYGECVQCTTNHIRPKMNTQWIQWNLNDWHGNWQYCIAYYGTISKYNRWNNIPKLNCYSNPLNYSLTNSKLKIEIRKKKLRKSKFAKI